MQPRALAVAGLAALQVRAALDQPAELVAVDQQARAVAVDQVEAPRLGVHDLGLRVLQTLEFACRTPRGDPVGGVAVGVGHGHEVDAAAPSEKLTRIQFSPTSSTAPGVPTGTITTPAGESGCASLRARISVDT